jgi:PKD repeat protein
MKKISLVLSVLFFAFAMQLNAQICDPPCTPNVGCVDIDNPGEVCPEVLPNATAGVYYDETLTVIPPSTFNIGGSDYDILKIRIDAVEGLPSGMEWCKSEEFFTVTDPFTRYCCQLKGTSDVVGEYPLTLKITPYYLFFGNPLALPQQTDNTLILIVTPALPPAPVAAFSADVTTTETGLNVSFTDESTNTPTSWAWIFEGGTPAASDVQNPVVTYSAVGTYDVSLTVANEGGEDFHMESDYITITSGSDINNALINSVKVYPNPATSEITIEAENLKSISIVDILGKVVYSEEANSAKEVIDISKLTKANYFIKVVTADGEITKTISIK